MHKVHEVYVYAKAIEKVLLIGHYETEDEAKEKVKKLKDSGETEVYTKTCLMDEYTFNFAMRYL